MSFGRITPEELQQRQQRGESVELFDVCMMGLMLAKMPWNRVT